MALGFLSRLGGGAGMHPGAAGMHGPLSGAAGAGVGAMGTSGLGTPGIGGGLGLAAAAGPTNMHGSSAALGGINGAAAPMGAAAGPRDEPLGGGLWSRGLGYDPLTGSSFALNRRTRHGRVLSAAAWSSRTPGQGWLAVDVRVRTLIVHQAEGFRERGVALVVQLQPAAGDAAGVYGQRGAVVGRAGDERGRGAVGPRDDGRHGPRRSRAGESAGRRGRLRAAGGEPLRRDAASRLLRVGVRPRLSALPREPPIEVQDEPSLLTSKGQGALSESYSGVVEETRRLEDAQSRLPSASWSRRRTRRRRRRRAPGMQRPMKGRFGSASSLRRCTRIGSCRPSSLTSKRVSPGPPRPLAIRATGHRER